MVRVIRPVSWSIRPAIPRRFVPRGAAGTAAGVAGPTAARVVAGVAGRTAARVVAAASAAALLAACSAGPVPSGEPGPSEGPSNGTSSARVAPARLDYALPDDAVTMVFPATGAETRWTQGLDTFGQQVARAAAASCAHDRGIGLPEQVPLAFIRLFELPDLDFIARHGMSESATVPAPAASSAATGGGSPAAIRECQAEGAAAAEELRDTYAPLQQRWFGELVSLRGDPATVRALRTLPGCLAEQGIQARDEQAFMALADAHMQTVAPADLPRAAHELGRAYATCMRPVEAVREPARQRLRARFLTEHADEVSELRATLVPSLRRTEKQLGVRLAFPAP
ncbi:hypothetical protein [Streptomyces sp. NPDC093544]|uniref:hypothetical protein n=1 Tax=Streptomyces sp. NPDC093544 TaxID=3155200 RepID=UPI00341893AE